MPCIDCTSLKKIKSVTFAHYHSHLSFSMSQNSLSRVTSCFAFAILFSICPVRVKFFTPYLLTTCPRNWMIRLNLMILEEFVFFILYSGL